jgi:hypothetical protein
MSDASTWQQFLYKAMHNTQKVGDFWAHATVPAMRQRQQCVLCDATDSMEHILIHCSSTPVNLIWSLAKNLWPHAPQEWPTINLGTILGCGSLSLPLSNTADQPDTTHPPLGHSGRTRLLIILLSEAAHLIWILRCERVIQN